KPPVVLWSPGEKYQPDLPVYRRATKLAYKKPTGNRTVSISVKENFSVLASKAEASVVTMNCDTELTEQPGVPDARGKSTLRVALNRFNAGFKVPDELVVDKKDKEKINKREQRVFNGAGHLDLLLLLNERGDVEQSNAIAKTAPPDIKLE